MMINSPDVARFKNTLLCRDAQACRQLQSGCQQGEFLNRLSPNVSDNIITKLAASLQKY